MHFFNKLRISNFKQKGSENTDLDLMIKNQIIYWYFSVQERNYEHKILIKSNLESCEMFTPLAIHVIRK